ncbi:hypothetical protein SeLEV6574_g02880 [Synchytrium endobioticum]|uniref:Uncharacterized protein n=1 Tax=Synchytrium endobioticum TaxID=286115 RepID=A0A507D6Q8_9FUNG|nr:hypothetical protein SeLEV6574_g02880 [Synchytrium endobioticum]
MNAAVLQASRQYTRQTLSSAACRSTRASLARACACACACPPSKHQPRLYSILTWWQSTSASPATTNPTTTTTTPTPSLPPSSLFTPNDTSTTFPQAYESLSSSLNLAPLTIRDRDLMDLFFRITTESEALQAESLVSKWRAAAKPWSPADSHVLVEALLRTGAHEVLLDRLCNVYKYALIPRQADIEALLREFRRQCSAANDNKDDDNTGPDQPQLKALDKCYRTFAVALYHHIVPSCQMYLDLIMAGIETGTEQGHCRSLVTRDEAISLGYDVPPL